MMISAKELSKSKANDLNGDDGHVERVPLISLWRIIAC